MFVNGRRIVTSPSSRVFVLATHDAPNVNLASTFLQDLNCVPHQETNNRTAARARRHGSPTSAHGVNKRFQQQSKRHETATQVSASYRMGSCIKIRTLFYRRVPDSSQGTVAVDEPQNMGKTHRNEEWLKPFSQSRKAGTFFQRTCKCHLFANSCVGHHNDHNRKIWCLFSNAVKC